MNNKISVFRLKDDLILRQRYIDSLLKPIKEINTELIDIIEYVIEDKIDLFDTEYFKYSISDEDDSLSDVILPTIVKLYIEFEKPSPLLRGKKVDVFKLSMDIDEFINKYIELSTILNNLFMLTNIDVASEISRLIINEYVGEKFSMAYDLNNIDDIEYHITELTKKRKSLLRDFKLIKLLKKK